MRRPGRVLLTIAAVVALMGCQGKTTPATKVTDASATLNATGRCDSGETCKWYWEYWRATQPRSTSVKTPVSGPVNGPTGDVNLSINIAGLAPNTTYRWVACGSPNNGGGYGCAGPNGTVGSTTADPPPDYGTFYTPASATLAERWNGSNWAIQSTPNASGQKDNALGDVWCTSATSCVAVGWSRDSMGHASTLAQGWNGTLWTAQAGGSSGELHAVSCTSATACTGVGWDGVLDVLIAQRWDGTTWTTTQNSRPAGTQNVSLNGVSCTSPTACTAVGTYYENSAGAMRTLAERWDGTSWTIQTTPNPGVHNELRGVLCTSATACIAVGDANRGDGTNGLVERWDGTTWTVQATPNPTGSGQNRELDGVSCTSTTACTAVGNDFDGSTETFKTLAERWNGTAWTVQPTPGAGLLFDVSCGSPTACIAVGSFTERWDGTTWTTQTTPIPPSGHGTPSNGVSCTSPTACTAVGNQ